MGRRISPGFTGGEVVGDIQLRDNTISATAADTNIVFDTTGTGIVTFPTRLEITDTTASTNSTTGALTVSGGLGIAGDLNIGGTLNGGVIDGIEIGATNPQPGTFTTLTATGLTSFNEIQEGIGTKTGANGTVAHDFTEANTWYHSSIANNFTVNLTNVPTTNNRVITINLILIQGATPRYASGFQIDGVGQTIRWAGYQPPTPSANRFELQTFTLFRQSSSWTVFGSLSSFG